MDFSGKHALILGLAREGEALARFLVEQGAYVTVTDSAPANKIEARVQRLRNLPVRFVLGGHHPELVSADVGAFFVSPGVPEDNPVYQMAADIGLGIQSMTTLFFDLCPGVIVGVTGSSGKTTTTGLIGHMLNAAGMDAVVGGNIGDPMLDLLPRVGSRTTVVLELSSFQLALLRRSPHVSVITNISPNHLDRHGTMESYVEAKRHSVAHQSSGGFAVLNARDQVVTSFAESTLGTIRWFGKSIGNREGADVEGGYIRLRSGDVSRPVLRVEDIPLLGEHNVENVLAAAASAAILGVDPVDMARAVRTFKAPAHRLEMVGEHAGVRFVDDSIATSPARAAVALNAFQHPVLLIAGGRDKNLPWDEFARLATQRVRALFLIGEAAPMIEHAIREHLSEPGARLTGDAIYRCASLSDAVSSAARIAHRGDIVLLSPGCTSYDMFDNFEERGHTFARAFEALDAA